MASPSGLQEEPNANSTFNNMPDNSERKTQSPRSTIEQSVAMNSSVEFNESSPDNSYSLGHISHIPRRPPNPATYTIPSIINKSIENENEHLFGMIKLKENDVCYTSGTLEWIGRKRSFPINSGFKIVNEGTRLFTEPILKKMKNNYTASVSADAVKTKECDCADVLPTVNAIVDHLNALHEAVDLVDLRLNTVEGALSKDN